MRFIKNLSIKIQLFIIVVVTIVTMVSIMTITYIQISDIIKLKNSQYTNEIINNLKTRISDNYSVINKLLVSLAYDSLIQEFLKSSSIGESYEISKKINKTVISIKALNDNIKDIVILGDSGSVFSLNGGVEEVDEARKKISESRNLGNSGFEKYSYNGRDMTCLIFGMPVYYSEPDKLYGNKIGFIAAIVDVSGMLSDMNRFSTQYGTRFYMVDKNGKVFSGEGNAKIDSSLSKILANMHQNQISINFNGSFSFIQENDFTEIEGKIISVVSSDKLYSEIKTVRQNAGILLLISIIILSVIFLLIINNILHPINRLMGFINEIKLGHLKALKKRLDLEGYYEIGKMAHEFNLMLDEIDILTHRLLETNSKLYEAELEKSKAELAYLISQINPHFLYNTFESIKGMAIEENATKTFKMTKSLAYIFRYSIKGEDYVTLGEELRALDYYLQIQQVRFDGRFKYDCRIPENMKRKRIIRMLLQPVVENSVKHGLEPKESNGELWIDGEIDKDSILVIRIRDNGVGIDRERLLEIQERLLDVDILNGYKEYSKGSKSIGISNVNRRLKLTYGNEFGLSLDSRPGQGTEVRLVFPCKEA